MKGMPAVEMEWRVEDDLRTLLEAEKIKKDSKRMKAVKELAKKKMEDMMHVASRTEE